ncbi:MAG TPA: glycoside hydrolase family 16 protein, partial [Chitinophaga sp.]
MNIDLKKINWEPGKAPSQLQLMTLRIRRKSDPDEERSYTTIVDDLQVYPDGTILNPPVIKDLDEGVIYNFRFQHNDPAGGRFDAEFITPLTYQTQPVQKSYYPGSELTFTGGNFRTNMLPNKFGAWNAYFSLEYTRADWFETYGDAIVLGDSEWAKKDDKSGLKLKDAGSNVLIRTVGDPFSSGQSTFYVFGVNFYVAAEDLPATGIWNLVYLTSLPNGDGVQVYVNCDTKKVHWRQQKGAVIEEIVSTNTINTNAWNQVLVGSPMMMPVPGMWLNDSNAFTGAFTEASRPMILQLMDGGIHVGDSGGIFSNFYYVPNVLENPDRYLNPIYPVGILEGYLNQEEPYSIPRKNISVIEDGRVVFILPPDVPTSSRRFYIQQGHIKFPAVDIHISYLGKVEYPVELDFSPEGGGGYSFKYVFRPLEKGWGGANGGVSRKHIYMQNDGLLVLEAHGDYYNGLSQGTSEDGTLKYHDHPEDPSTPLPWTTRVGAAIVSKDYYGYGRYIVEAKLPPEMGVAPAFWISNYSKIYPQDTRFEEVVARGLHIQGDQYNGRYYVVEKNEIDMELPSNNVSRTFYSLDDMVSSYYAISWTGQRVAVVEDPDPANIGTWQLMNGTAPDQLASWTKISDEIQALHQPRKDNARCSNWKGEIGYGDGSNPEDEFVTMPTNIGIDVWDGEFHEFRFDWYADRIEFYVDGGLILVSRHLVPDVAGRWKIGLWFPSKQGNADQPWRLDPYSAWAGPTAAWKYQKMFIKRIAHTPFPDVVAG